MSQTKSPFPPPPEKRSPFPHRSLPQAGESLQQAAFELFLDKFIFYFFAAVGFAMIAWVEWVQRWFGHRMSPWFWTFIAVALAAFAAVRWFTVRSRLLPLIQAIRGEREVGRMLEELRGLGYAVFHDIPGDGFNVDHALIGPAGIFAIETKTRSKPRGRDVKIVYDGECVKVDGHEPDRDPIAQALGAAAHVRELLERMTGRKGIYVRPVVLFPGWFVDPQPKGCEVWVLNPKVLRPFLVREGQSLKREDVALFADRLRIHLSPPDDT